MARKRILGRAEYYGIVASDPTCVGKLGVPAGLLQLLNVELHM